MTLQITDQFIQACRDADACDEGLAWISQTPRPTLAELHAHDPGWARWAALYCQTLTDAEAEELQRLTGCRTWWRDGVLHREDGPAVEQPGDYRAWYCDGVLHREDGPAVEGWDDYRAWYCDGVLHREDGPAIEGRSGYRAWWRYGKFLRSEPGQ